MMDVDEKEWEFTARKEYKHNNEGEFTITSLHQIETENMIERYFDAENYISKFVENATSNLF